MSPWPTNIKMHFMEPRKHRLTLTLASTSVTAIASPLPSTFRKGNGMHRGQNPFVEPGTDGSGNTPCPPPAPPAATHRTRGNQEDAEEKLDPSPGRKGHRQRRPPWTLPPPREGARATPWSREPQLFSALRLFVWGPSRSRIHTSNSEPFWATGQGRKGTGRSRAASA